MNKVFLLFALSLSWSSLVTASQDIDERIVVALEEPAANSTVSGVGNLRGWAVGPDGIDYVEFYVDGVLKKEIPYGAARGDIADTYPNFPDSHYSGFSSAYAYGMLTPGTHTLKIKAVSAAGKYKEVSNTFEVTRFHKGYFSDPKAMDISKSSVSQDGAGILLKNIKVEGKTYNVRLEWQVPSQQFDIVDIATENSAGMPWVGNWLQVNFLGTDETEFDDDDDLSGIGFSANITETTWKEYGETGCTVTFDYSVDANRHHSKTATNVSSGCPWGNEALPYLDETGWLEFEGDFMNEFFDLQPGDEISAFRWMRQ